MKSSFLEKSKRALVLLLTGAMIATSVPSTAFAATVDADTEDEVIFEDTQDVVESDAASLNEVAGGEIVNEDTSDYVDPDNAYGDATLTFAAISSGDDVNRKAFKLAGDVATPVITESTSGVTLVSFDSTRDFVFYVVPKMGVVYDTGEVPVTITGTYTYKTEGATEYTATAGTDYVIEDSDITKASVNGSYTAWDFALGKKITIKGNSDFSKALATAASEFASGKNPKLTVEMAKPTGTGRVQLNAVYDEGLTRPAVDLVVNTYRPAFESAYVQSMTNLIDTADRSKTIVAKVSLENGTAANSIEFDEVPASTSWTDSSVDKNYKYENGTLKVSTAAINYAYNMAKPVNGGYKLTVTFAEGETAASNDVTVAPESIDYITFAKIDNKSVADATTITTDGINITKGNDVVFFATKASTADDSTRKILSIDYTVEGTVGTKRAVAKNVKVLNTGASYLVAGVDTGYDAATVGSADNEYTLVSGAAYYIAGANVTGNITLSPVTGEQVIVKNNYDTVESKQKIAFKVATETATSKTLGTTASTTLAGTATWSTDHYTFAATESEAFTGKDYVFYVIPTDGYKVNSVKVDQYDKSGVNASQCTVANGKLVEGDYGKYTISSITGRLDITVDAEKEATSLLTAKKVGDAADVTLYRVSDKKEITASAQEFVKSGDSLKFKAIPVQGKAIKAVSYSKGSSTTYTPVTGIPDGTGAYNFEIAAIDDNINIKVESEAGFSFVKKANPYSTVKINGVELKDGAAIAGVPAGESGISITVEGKDAEVKNVWYGYAAADPNYANASAMTAVPKLSTTGGNLGLSYLTSSAANANTYEFYIYVQTERAENEANYTAKITKDSSSDALESLTLYAGGTGLNVSEALQGNATAGKEFSDLTVAFSRKDFVSVPGSNASNTTYTLGKTGDEAIAAFFPQEATGFNRINTTKLANTADMTDTITVKEVIGASSWLDQLSYTATLPLTVKPLKSQYDAGIKLISEVKQNGSNKITGLAGLGKTAIRVYDRSNSSVFDDYSDITIMPYMLDENGEEVARGGGIVVANEIGANNEITKIEWTTDPKYSATNVVKDLEINPTNALGEKLSVTKVKDPGTINVTAKITFVDGSTDEAAIALTAFEQTYGYGALAIITRNEETEIVADDTTINLEKKAGGINSAEVSYRVFERLDSTSFANHVGAIKALDTVNGQITDENITKYIVEGAGKDKLKEISNATLGDATGNYDKTKKVTVTTSGNKYTISATAVGESTVIGTPTVSGAPMSEIPTITAKVANELETISFTMALGDSDGATGSYDKPQLKADATILTNAHSNTGSDEAGKITGFVFDQIIDGSSVTLPSIDDFDLTTVNPKYTLVGWQVDTSAYKAPGTSYKVVSGKTVTAIWAPKYEDVTVYNDMTDALIKSAENIGIGISIPLSLRYKAIDWETTPNATTGAVTYSTEFTKAASGLTIKKAVADSSALTIDGATITGAAANAGAVVNYEWVDPDATYTEEKVADATYKTTKVLVNGGSGSTTFTVATLSKYKLEMDPVTVQEGQTKDFAAYYYPDATGKTTDDAVNFNDSAIASVSAKIKEGGEANAEAESVSHSTSDNKIAITGRKAGTTATLVLTVVSAQNDKTEIEVPITITASDKKIVLKKVAGVDVTTDDIQIMVDEESTNGAGVKTDAVFEYVEGTTSQPTVKTDWTITDATSTEVKAAVKAVNATQDNGTGISVSGTAVTIPVNTVSNTFGTGTIKLTYKVSDEETYSQWFDVNTFYSFTFKVQTGSETNGGIYVVKNDGTAVDNSEDMVEKVVYSGADTYTVASAAKYTAEYPFGAGKNTDAEKTFLGWGKTAAKFDNTAADYEAGKAITVDPTALPFSAGTENIDLYVSFGTAPITEITGLDTIIRLTDENPGAAASTAVSTASNVLSDYIVENIGQNPVASTATITVTADDISLFTITDGTNATTVAVPDRDDTHNVSGSSNTKMLWSTGQGTAGGNITMTTVGTGTSKVGSFAVAKVSGKVGVSMIHVASGNLKYDIPVYLNGEFTDTDGKIKYMEDGEILEEGSRIVGGKAHFYKEGVQVTDDVIEITIDGAKKLVLIEAGAQVKTPAGGTRVFKGKTYYMGKDGFVKNGGLFTGEGSSDTEFSYYANEDGTLAINELKAISGKTYYFDASGHLAKAPATANLYAATSDGKYYVNKDGEVATAGLFKVDGKDYLFREDSTIVAYADEDVKDGQIEIAGVIYDIDKDTNEAKIAKEFFYEGYEIVEWKWNSGSPTVTVKMIYKAEDGTDASEILTDIPATTTDGADVVMKTYKATAVAKFIKKGETEKKTEEFTKMYDKDGKSDVWYAPSVEWTTKFASKWSKSDAIPTMKYKVTYTSKESGKQVTTEELIASVTPASVTSNATEVTFVATADLSAYYTNETGATVVDPTKIAKSTMSKTYKFSAKDPTQGTSGQEIAPEAGISIEDLEEEYFYVGKAIIPAFKVVDDEAGVTLANGVDYTVKFAGNNPNLKKVTLPAKATVTVTGKGNYSGSNSTATFTIVDPKIGEDLTELAGNVKKVVKPAALTYTGEPVYPAEIVVTMATKPVTTVTLEGDGNGGYTNKDSAGKDLIVTVTNNINKGNGIVAVTGSDGVTKSTTFKINPAPITSLGETDIEVADEAVYRVKGATPDITLSFNGEELVPNQDYTVKYSKNKAVGSATATISGKGNFSGKLGAKTFNVKALSLEDCVFDAATVFEGSKAAGVKATILDPNGDALKANKDYTLALELEEGATDTKGKLVAGKSVKITATAAGSNIEASTTADNTFTVGSNLGKAKVVSNKNVITKTYTGEPIFLTDEDFDKISVTINKTTTLKYGEDFEVAGYTNNVKKGNMTVTIVGTGVDNGRGVISGVKTFKVTIVPKPISQ